MSYLCQVCGRKATSQCSQCENTMYCGQACADTDWEHGGHERVCCPVAELETSAYALARRIFMESAMPTTTPEAREEAQELVEALLFEHCAEEFFTENPHLIDAYLEQQLEEEGEAFIGASLDGSPEAEEDHLATELAMVRAEALTWLEDVHLRDSFSYPGFYGLDAIGAEFGQRSAHWKKDQSQLENEFIEALSDIWEAVKGAGSKAWEGLKAGGRAVAKAAQTAGRGIAKGARAAAGAISKGAKAAGRGIAKGARKARDLAQSGARKVKEFATSAATKVKGLASRAKKSIVSGARKAKAAIQSKGQSLSRAVRTKVRGAQRSFKTFRSNRRIRQQGKRSIRTKQILAKDAARRSSSSSSVLPLVAPSSGRGRSSSASESSSSSSDSDSDSSSREDSPRESKSDSREDARAAKEEARRQREADKAERQREKKAESLRRRQEKEQRARDEAARRKAKEDEARIAQAEQDEQNRIAQAEQDERDRIAQADQDERDRIRQAEQAEREQQNRIAQAEREQRARDQAARLKAQRDARMADLEAKRLAIEQRRQELALRQSSTRTTPTTPTYSTPSVYAPPAPAPATYSTYGGGGYVPQSPPPQPSVVVVQPSPPPSPTVPRAAPTTEAEKRTRRDQLNQEALDFVRQEKEWKSQIELLTGLVAKAVKKQKDIEKRFKTPGATTEQFADWQVELEEAKRQVGVQEKRLDDARRKEAVAESNYNQRMSELERVRGRIVWK